MRWIYDDGGRAAAGHTEEVNDCVCRAIAIVTERPYHEIWCELRDLMLAQISKSKSGVEEYVEHQLMEKLGWTWVPTYHKRLQEGDIPSGRLIVHIRGHSVAVIDGVIHDRSDCSLNRTGMPQWIYGYYKQGVAIKDHTLNPDRKKVLDTVTKLLALAEGGATKAEATTAKEKAALLIAKYDISVADAEDLEGFEDETEFRTGDVPSYEFRLLGSLGRFCGVLVLITARRSGGHNYKFYGKPQDLEALHYLRESVSAQRDREWMDYLAGAPRTRAREKVSWKYSYANGVEIKVKELTRAAKAQQKALRQDLVLIPRHQ